MNLSAWLLVLLVGGHSGYITVPDLASERQCDELGRALQMRHVPHLFRDPATTEPQWKCYVYEKAPGTR